MKTCTKCGECKAVGEFYRRSVSKDGRQSRCKVCHRESSANWYAKNAEHLRENAAKWRVENRDRKRDTDAKWRAENPDYHADRYANDPEFRERRCANVAKRRALSKGLPADGSGIPDWLAHHEETDSWACHLCGGAFTGADEIHWDHRDPVSTGTAGTVVANMAAAHATCNVSRGNVPLDVWHERLGLPDGVV